MRLILGAFAVAQQATLVESINVIVIIVCSHDRLLGWRAIAQETCCRLIIAERENDRGSDIVVGYPAGDTAQPGIDRSQERLA